MAEGSILFVGPRLDDLLHLHGGGAGAPQANRFCRLMHPKFRMTSYYVPTGEARERKEVAILVNDHDRIYVGGISADAPVMEHVICRAEAGAEAETAAYDRVETDLTEPRVLGVLRQMGNYVVMQSNDSPSILADGSLRFARPRVGHDLFLNSIANNLTQAQAFCRLANRRFAGSDARESLQPAAEAVNAATFYFDNDVPVISKIRADSRWPLEFVVCRLD